MGETESSKSRVLIVDDSATILATAKKMLVDEFEVLTAKNGEEAWELISNNSDISIVFSDMQMPVMNGMQLLLTIRESDDARISRLPVIMVTGASDSPAGKRAVFEIGATDFIGKPFDAMDLLSRARSNIKPHRRAKDHSADNDREVFISPSGFQNIGKEAFTRALETREEFSVVSIELANLDEIKRTVDSKSVRQIIVSLVKRISSVLRERDVATRIGENKFAILLYSNDYNTKQAVERLCEYMKKLVFELNGSTLRTDLAYGYASVNCYDSDSSFVELFRHSDTALQEALNIKLGNKIAAFGEGGGNKVEVSNTDAVDMWQSLTHVADGDYHLVDEAHIDGLLKCMKDFMAYTEKTK
jgi:diguanylate cyclase (GGDEF)-like protein